MGAPSSSSAAAAALEAERERRRRTGCFCEALVEGLRSWVGEGARLREKDWRVEARVGAGLVDIVVEVVVVVVIGGGSSRGW